ncbi:uncharacterized protein LOC112032595 [Quercus suber]|uniref:uncharacterized protein LOC112032595 n=1 Tax=Quercus suber TaxID=58331 RepID=UPI000CE17C7E|nr:putative polyol transporter 2 [Quercus suber]
MVFLEEEEGVILNSLWQLVFVLSVGFVSSLGGLNAGLDNGLLLTHSKELESKYFLTDGFLSFCSALMTFVGGVLGVIISEKKGRKLALYLSSFLLFCGSLFCLSSVKGLFLSGRVLNGIGVGVTFTVTQVYTTEISPDKYRGCLVSLFSLSLAIGQAVPDFLSIIGDVVGTQFPWNQILYISCVLPVCQCLTLLLLPESPKWDSKLELKTHLKNFFSQSLLPSILLTLLLTAIEMSVGVNALTYLSTNFINDQPRGHSSANSLFTSFLGITGNLVATVFVDLVGRKRLFVASLSSVLIELLLLGVFLKVESKQKIMPITLCIFYFYTVCSTVSSVVTAVLSVELFPSTFTTLGLSFFEICKCLANIPTSLTMKPMMNVLGEGGYFFLCCGFLLSGIILVLVFLSETSGVPLEDIGNEGFHSQGLKKFKEKLGSLFN